MRIGGFQRSSLIDYPGMISAVVFTQGCNFRCSYCHNPELVYPCAYRMPISDDDVLFFLKRRRSLLDGVVISGGEALLQNDLATFLHRVKSLGYSIKLDTNGSLPDDLNAVIRKRLVDYIAMDIKAPFDKYAEIAGVQVDTNAIRESIRVIVQSGVKHQFRTTKADVLLNEDIATIHDYTGRSGDHVVQRIQPIGTAQQNTG
jgi:pyruvate formate lyase activating enzyme